MCGISGYIGKGGQLELESIVRKMANTLVYRGPDDSGVWVDARYGVALGHRRLSIVDLSEAGHQPMQSACGRYVIAFNGEIYNFRLLRTDLEGAGHTFRGHSDTEVLLALIAEYGLETTLSKVNGMFAFALWDCQRQTLTFVRDRFGKKPLYFGWVKGAFVFGSELKSLKAHPGFSNEIDRRALTLYLRHNCIPAPYSIYQKIYKLPAGASCTLSLNQIRNSSCYEDVASDIQHYWSPEQVCETGLMNPFITSDKEIEDQLDSLLRETVAQRMIADVPLGAFLSGGIDSSLIVALMQAQSTCPVKTFTIGFQEAAHNEADDAKRVAECLGTEHYEHYFSPQDALDVVPKLPTIYDEPFADSSQIPTYLVSTFARKHVSVALSGDGGDELFGGYNRYTYAPDIWNRMTKWPAFMRGTASVLLEGIPPRAWPMLASALNLNYRTPADKAYKLAAILKASSPAEIYKVLTTHWSHPAEVVIDGNEPDTLATNAANVIERFGFEQGMMCLDQMTYLPDDIMVKVDRASMSASLEARSPLLDYRVAVFASRLPLDLKVKDRQGKYLLRKLLKRYLPQDLIERPKMGFEMPIAAWLRGPLRDWAESLLCETRLINDGFFYPGLIRQRWSEHLSGKRNWQFHLWDILMFHAWLDDQRG